MNIGRIIETFADYVGKYDTYDINICLKVNHSYRVMSLCDRIAQSLDFSDSDIDLAIVIGILHDYARFEQWDKYKTFSDSASVDHGDLAVKRLFEDNEIEKFNIPIEYYETIYNAIKYHNKLDYPKNISERDLMFCKLIKDADKLDIFYLISQGTIKVYDDDRNISKCINNDFYENKLSKRESIKTDNDRIIFYLNMMYDLNFKYSYKYIKENNLIQSIFSLINKKERFVDYFNYIDDYVEERSKEYVRKKI